MATSSAINATFNGGTQGLSEPERPPTTSRPSVLAPETSSADQNNAESSPNTPTRHNFGGVLGQRPLPDIPPTSTNQDHESSQTDAQTRSDRANGAVKSQSDIDAQDVDMGDGEDDGILDDDDGSGNESMTSDTQRPSKKKKGQRFFCTDFPPCQLSFTRSEHLARHIRKHTGERPFQCHCSRRFSRLDNLRQHAQTVHVNEEIPGDSLAAQSTRFQRQIRTDRVRPTSSRSRASTIGSQGGHSRGHSRNLSASSIGSTTSSIGVPEDSRRRPQPLAMANDGSARARLTIETFANVGASPTSQYAYYNPSPTGYSTPTSSTFTPGTGSPQFQSAVVSPSSVMSRSSFYNGARTHARRLSVPSTQNPFHNHGGTHPPPYFGPIASGPSSAFSPTSQVFASPTSSVFSHGRRDSETEMDHRRRTWHPSTNSQYTQRPATSGLTFYQTPDEPRPAFSQQPAASQMTRLPGIESFDHAPPPASRQPSSPMMLNATPRPHSSGRAMEAGLQQGLTRLDIASANAPSDGHWQAPQHAPHAPANSYVRQGSATQVQYVQPQHVSMPEQPVTPRKNKRNAWYGGPVNPPPIVQPVGPVTVRTSPEDSGSSDGVATPSVSHLTEFYPVIVNHSSVSETYPPGAVIPEEHKHYYNNADHPPKAGPTRSDSGFQGIPQDQLQQQSTPTQQTYTLPASHDPRHSQPHYSRPPSNDMAKLEALVAVAASQSRAVEHQS